MLYSVLRRNTAKRYIRRIFQVTLCLLLGVTLLLQQWIRLFSLSLEFSGHTLPSDMLPGDEWWRSVHFPSVETRIKYYLGNWYSPACEENTQGFVWYSVAPNHSLSSSTPNMVLREIETGREIEISSEPARGSKMFYVDRDAILNCSVRRFVQGPPRGYCRDVKDIILPAMERLEWKTPSQGGVPIIFRFGDSYLDHD